MPKMPKNISMYDHLYEDITKFYCEQECKDLTFDEAMDLRRFIEDQFDLFIAELSSDVKKFNFIGYKWD